MSSERASSRPYHHRDVEANWEGTGWSTRKGHGHEPLTRQDRRRKSVDEGSIIEPATSHRDMPTDVEGRLMLTYI